MRIRPALLIGAVLLIACDSSTPIKTPPSRAIEVTIEIVPPPQGLPVVEVAISGPDFFQQIELADDPVILVVPRHDRYLFQVGGLVEEQTGPTSGCWWHGPPTWVEVSAPTTVQLDVGQACG